MSLKFSFYASCLQSFIFLSNSSGTHRTQTFIISKCFVQDNPTVSATCCTLTPFLTIFSTDRHPKQGSTSRLVLLRWNLAACCLTVAHNGTCPPWTTGIRLCIFLLSPLSTSGESICEILFAHFVRIEAFLAGLACSCLNVGKAFPWTGTLFQYCDFLQPKVTTSVTAFGAGSIVRMQFWLEYATWHAGDGLS